MKHTRSILEIPVYVQNAQSRHYGYVLSETSQRRPESPGYLCRVQENKNEVKDHVMGHVTGYVVLCLAEYSEK